MIPRMLFIRYSVTNYSKGNFRSNIDADITDNVLISFDLSGSQENSSYPTRDAQHIFTSIITGGAGSGGRPNVVAIYPGDKPAAGFINGMNPAVMGTDVMGYDKGNYYNLLSNLT